MFYPKAFGIPVEQAADAEHRAGAGRHPEPAERRVRDEYQQRNERAVNQAQKSEGAVLLRIVAVAFLLLEVNGCSHLREELFNALLFLRRTRICEKARSQEPRRADDGVQQYTRSEEHTSELQSLRH